MRGLLREIIDPAVEHVQYAKQQRERIHNDSVYFTATKPPENAPSWTYVDLNYETDVDPESIGDEREDIPEDDDFFQSDYYLYSAEMNAIRPEDLSHPAESSKPVESPEPVEPQEPVEPPKPVSV